jgi:predicted Zn-dependent peptidase
MIKAVTKEKVKEIAQKYLNPRNYILAVAG